MTVAQVTRHKHNRTIPWMEGRHGTAAIAAILFSSAWAWLSLLIFPGITQAIPAYIDQVCLPGPSRAQYGERTLYVGCPTGTIQERMVVPLSEVVCVIGIAAAVVCFSSLMPFWERFDHRRSMLGSLIAAAVSIILPVGSAFLAGMSFRAAIRSNMMLVVAGNIFIDATLVIIGLALLGRYYGLGLGVLLAVTNVLTQNVQAPTGFALRLYLPMSATTHTPSTSVVMAITAVASIIAVFAWAHTGGQGIIQLRITNAEQ